MNLTNRTYRPEMLDSDDIPFEDIRLNMQELNTINKWLGGHAITTGAVKQFTQNKKQLLICEIGCGGGDNLVAIHQWCVKNNVAATFIGVDIKEACIAFAKTRKLLNNIAIWEVSDYTKVVFDAKPDIVFSSLFCHHFSNEALVTQLQWMQLNSTAGFFINDLQRNKWAYVLIKYLTKSFSSSYLVKNDAPLSVARSFHKNEWRKLFKQAGVQPVQIKWQWAFRFLIIYKHAGQ